MRITCPLLTTHVLRQDLPGTPSGWDSDLLCDDTAGAGGGPLRSESARRLTPEIRQSKFPGTPRPSVTLALAAPGPPVQLRWTTLRVQGPTLRDAALANGGDGSPPVAPRLLHQPHPGLFLVRCDPAGGGRTGSPRAQLRSWQPGRRP